MRCTLGQSTFIGEVLKRFLRNANSSTQNTYLRLEASGLLHDLVAIKSVGRVLPVASREIPERGAAFGRGGLVVRAEVRYVDGGREGRGTRVPRICLCLSGRPRDAGRIELPRRRNELGRTHRASVPAARCVDFPERA